MLVFRDEDRHSRRRARPDQAPVHLEPAGQVSELFSQARFVEIEGAWIPFHAHEKEAETVVLMLVGVENVAAVIGQKTGHRRHNTFAVGTMDQQNCRI